MLLLPRSLILNFIGRLNGIDGLLESTFEVVAMLASSEPMLLPAVRIKEWKALAHWSTCDQADSTRSRCH